MEFLEVVHIGGKKRLVNLEKVIALEEERDGTAFIKTHDSHNGKTAFGISTAESYEEVKAKILYQGVKKSNEEN